MSILDDIKKLSSETLITLYELDLSTCIGKFGETTSDVYRWCDGVNELGRDIEWDSQVYTRYPIKTQGFDKMGDGTIPRPKLIIANISGTISGLTRQYNDLTGAKLKRTRTFLKYLDSSNFIAHNLLPYSTNLESITWTKNNYTVLSAGSIDINSGTQPLFSITEDNSLSEKTIHNSNLELVASTRYCFSIYAQAGIRDNIGLEIRTKLFSESLTNLSNNPIVHKAYFNLKGLPTPEPTQGITSSITYEGNNTYRLSISFEADVDSSIGYVSVFGLDSSWQTAYLGNNSAPAMYLSSIQLESGTKFPRSYFPVANSNLGNPFADSTQYLDIETWIIDRKASATSSYIEWELTAPYDIVGVKLPRRQAIQNICPWKYRSTECSYTGTNYFSIKDIPVVSENLDKCGKHLTSCQKRFGTTAVLPFGGFPALGLY